MITFSDVEEARRRIGDSVFLSPCAYSETLSRATGNKVWLKLENLQMTGSFKERGACNKLKSLTDTERARGVICASAGNHAQGIAYHSKRLGIDAKIVMPLNTPLIKVQSTRDFGGHVVLHGATFDDANEEAQRIQALEDRIFVHPFNDDLIIAGQGTIGLELLEQNPYLDAIVVAIGGGGLAAGLALAVKETNPKIKVYGVESLAFPSMQEALKAGHPVTIEPTRTIAEGIAVRRAGDKTLELVQRYVDAVVSVDEEEIAEAILMLLEREKTVAEGAGAAPLAALLHHRLPLVGKKVAVVVCGGNIDVTMISRIIERGLVKSGRMVRLLVKVHDVTGSLALLTQAVADVKANIVQIQHDRTFANTELNEAVVQLVLETRGFEHVAEVRAALQARGYEVEVR
ncbi:MAG: threonine ammonia-lyase [Polyangiaceae bacterium]